eukprot:CAMPEP_0117693828 /NCGR_PEP_ID=MMETSP0804-20121206/27107_1 /TAXON_ID=1074897 /ORGANISM="Tetraselmis astigmatica, Strain CCMP880" /LENGTH=31 /DNA_ID= /DNA_START= /DNA_END= /DNA_ORIENTATION=
MHAASANSPKGEKPQRLRAGLRAHMATPSNW